MPVLHVRLIRWAAAAMILVVATATTAAQEARYSEERMAPSRVPEAARTLAEREAPGVRFGAVYRDTEAGYRFVGRGADGRTFSVRIDRGGALDERSIYTDVPQGKLPVAVAATLRHELARNPELAGFAAARTSQVERFTGRDRQTTRFYEVFGHTTVGTHPRIELEPSGQVLKVDTGFVPNPEDATRRESLTARQTPPEVLQGIDAAVPGLKLSRLDRLTSTIGPEPDVRYQAYGKVDGRRPALVTTTERGHAFVVSLAIPTAEVPRAVIEAIARAAADDQRLKRFRPTEAYLRHLVDAGSDRTVLLGDDPDGLPLEVVVDGAGQVLAMRDTEEPYREAAGLAPTARRAPAAAPSDPSAPAPAGASYTVLAARYGTDHHWVDVTGDLRAAVTEGRTVFEPAGLPDAARERHKTLVVLFAVEEKVGLAVARDDEPLSLAPPADASTLAAIPARGFALLAARFGYEGRWADVTEPVARRIAGGRLKIKPVDAGLTDPAPGEPKALAIAYASEGQAGLYVQSQQRFTNLPPDGPPINSGTLEAHTIPFEAAPSIVAFTPDGREVIVGVEDGSLRFLDAATGRELRRFDGDRPGWHPLAVSGDGRRVASGDEDGVVRIREIANGRETAVLRGHTAKIRRIAFSPTNRLVATTGWDKTVRLWDATSGQELRRLEGHSDFVDGVAFTPDGRRLVTASWDRTARVWDAATGRELQVLTTEGDALGDVAVSRSGRDVLLGAKDGTFRGWQPANRRPAATVATGTECETACAVLPDGQRVLVSDKVAAALWDLQTGHPVLRLERHVGRLTGIAVAPDGRRAVTCGEDRTVRLWNLPVPGRPANGRARTAPGN